MFFAVLVLVADGGFRIQKQKTAIRQRDKNQSLRRKSWPKTFLFLLKGLVGFPWASFVFCNAGSR